MNKTTIAIIITLVIGAAGGYLVGHHQGMNMDMSDMAGMHQMPDGTMMSDGSMDDMGAMNHSAMMVSSEREFVAGMIPHHQEAVDTANEVLARGGSTERIRTLAEDIIAAQEKEIADLKQWHLDWFGEEYVETGSYEPMMRELSQLSGADLDRQFLQDMIPHHQGAIMMANSVLPHIEHEEITVMADAIVETQQAEIELMKELLTEL